MCNDKFQDIPVVFSAVSNFIHHCFDQENSKPADLSVGDIYSKVRFGCGQGIESITVVDDLNDKPVVLICVRKYFKFAISFFVRVTANVDYSFLKRKF